MSSQMIVMSKLVSLSFVLLLAFSAIGCFGESSEKKEKDTKKNAAETEKKDPIKAEIKSLRNADFDYIYVIRRKDGEKMDADDKKFITDNDHPTTNRRTLSKDEKVVFLGSNFAFPEAGLENIQDRFEVEDFSKPKEQIKKEKEERKKKSEEAKTLDDPKTPKKGDRSRFDGEEEDREEQ